MKNLLSSIRLSTSAAGVTAMLYASNVWAQSFAGPDPDINGIPDGAGDVRGTIVRIIEAVLNFLALIAVIVVIVAGIRLIVSQGEDEAKEKAKKTILYALVGLVVVLFARVIVGLVTDYLAGEVGA